VYACVRLFPASVCVRVCERECACTGESVCVCVSACVSV